MNRYIKIPERKKKRGGQRGGWKTRGKGKKENEERKTRRKTRRKKKTFFSTHICNPENLNLRQSYVTCTVYPQKQSVTAFKSRATEAQKAFGRSLWACTVQRKPSSVAASPSKHVSRTQQRTVSPLTQCAPIHQKHKPLLVCSPPFFWRLPPLLIFFSLSLICITRPVNFRGPLNFWHPRKQKKPTPEILVYIPSLSSPITFTCTAIQQFLWYKYAIGKLTVPKNNSRWGTFTRGQQKPQKRKQEKSTADTHHIVQWNQVFFPLSNINNYSSSTSIVDMLC